MATRLTRYLQLIFGSAAGSGRIAGYGTLASGSPVAYAGSAITPTLVQQDTAAFADGLDGAVIGDGAPALQDHNSLFYLYSYQLAYLFQQGIPEYDSGTQYFSNSLVMRDNGILYQATGSALGLAPPSSPWVVFGGTGEPVMATFSGSGAYSYSAPSGTKYVTIELQGAGGGGGGSGTSPGSGNGGGSSSVAWNGGSFTLYCLGGGGGLGSPGTGVGGGGGAGSAVGLGSSVSASYIVTQGNAGQGLIIDAAVNTVSTSGGVGGAGFWGGAGLGGPTGGTGGSAGLEGGGGGGGNNASNLVNSSNGPGGGSGAYAKAVIKQAFLPAGSFTITLAPGGNGGSGGGSGFSGGKGGDAKCVITAFFS